MIQVSVEEIQRDLPAYLQRVEAGETLVIIRARQPVAEIIPVVAHVKPLQPFGLCASTKYGRSRSRQRAGTATHPPCYGLTIVRCEQGDIRQSADGLWIYGEPAHKPRL